MQLYQTAPCVTAQCGSLCHINNNNIPHEISWILFYSNTLCSVFYAFVFARMQTTVCSVFKLLSFNRVVYSRERQAAWGYFTVCFLLYAFFLQETSIYSIFCSTKKIFLPHRYCFLNGSCFLLYGFARRFYIVGFLYLPSLPVF